LEVEIEKLVYGGWGLGRSEGKVVFVPLTVPGDRVEVVVRTEKKRYIHAQARQILQPGPGRQDPPCAHFGRCGGCQWQHLAYPRQVEAKRAILTELFSHRFPDSRAPGIEMRASPQDLGYRSRARIRVQIRPGGSKTGFLRLQSHRVEDIGMCPLLQASLNEGLTSVRSAVARLSAGTLLGHVDLIGSESASEWSAFGIVADSGPAGERVLEIPGIPNHTLERQVGQFRYRVAPETFFQANAYLTGALSETVVRLAAGCGSGAALDLFAGIGLFSLPLAGHFTRVVAIENSPRACELGRSNALDAGLSHVEFHCGDVAAWLGAAGSATAGAFDLILLDPPRSGAGAGVIGRIAELAPRAILYVSCDPQTLVRDLAALPRDRYGIDHIEGLDLFPQTYHFETVVRLVRR